MLLLSGVTTSPDLNIMTERSGISEANRARASRYVN